MPDLPIDKNECRRQDSCSSKTDETPTRPFERIHLDTIGPIPSVGGNPYHHILVIRDALTRFTVMEPLRTLEAQEITTAVEQQFIAIFGIPESVVTDNHRSLVGKAFKELEVTYGIKPHIDMSV
jgi:hypothetical protein